MIIEAAIALGLTALLILLMTAALSPLEALQWWAGWSERELDGEPEPGAVTAPPADETKRLYIVYLSGVASITGEYLLPRERRFIRRLGQALPRAVVVDDVFPYSPKGLSLSAGSRLFDRLWRRLQSLSVEGRRPILLFLINLRNILQVMVSADHRYGPIFNQGVADAIERALADAGYPRHTRAPIALIGYSGGAQVALGATPYLTLRLGAPVDVISIGGVMASDPGIGAVASLHHLQGEGDKVSRIGAAIFPERWAIMGHSQWNLAKAAGRLCVHDMSNMIHAGPHGYFGLPMTHGVSNNDRTLAHVVSLLKAAHEF